MGGNLNGWTPKKAITWWTTIKKYWMTFALVVASITYGGNEGYKYFIEHYNKEIPSAKIELKQKQQQSLGMSAAFSDPSLRAELIIPNQKVDVYKLVKISTTQKGSFYDLLVMTVQENQILFVDTVETKDGGWVFTGSPGLYSLRLIVFDPQTGFSASTGQVQIGNGPQPPPLLQPTIDLKVVPDTIKVGETATISWTTTNATTVSLNGINVPITGIQVVNPSVTSTYTLTATGSGGTINKTVTLNVENNPGPNPIPEGKYGFGSSMYDVIKSKVPNQYWQYASGLADNFEGVASGQAAGAFPTPSAMNTELAGRNRLTLKNDQTIINAWLPFFQAWADRASSLNKEGKLANIGDEYAIVYRETVLALRQLSKSTSAKSFDEQFQADHLVYERYKQAFNK
jgi:hypothetical protein